MGSTKKEKVMVKVLQDDKLLAAYADTVDLLTKALEAANLAIDVLVKANTITSPPFQSFEEEFAGGIVPLSPKDQAHFHAELHKEPEPETPTRRNYYNELRQQGQEVDLTTQPVEDIKLA